MTDAAALLAAIRDTPDDDAPRLIYADWLNEHGQEERAEFIRAHIYAFRSKLEGATLKHKRVRYGRWEWTHSPSYSPDCPSACGIPYQWKEPASISRGIRAAIESYVVRRGFVELITCTAADCLQHLDAILAEHPVREVTLTTWPELEVSHDGIFGRAKLRGFNRRNAVYVQFNRSDESSVYDHVGGAIAKLMHYNWPGVTFRFPERAAGVDPAGAPGNYSAYMSAIRRAIVDSIGLSADLAR